MLYNFIEDNDLCVVNFIYSQDVNFTYSNANGSSYIDHILVPDYVMDMVTDCKILNRDIDNISDHYAVSLTMNISVYVKQPKIVSSLTESNTNMRLSWHDPKFQRLYSEELTRVLENITIDKNIDSPDAAIYVKVPYEKLSSAMNEAAETLSKRFLIISKRRKPWWNTSCNIARNRHRLFYQIWDAMGRPREGQAYACYKEARRAYKRICRKSVHKKTLKRFKLIDKLSSEKKVGRMWNLIRKSKRSNCPASAISLQRLEEYFTEKFGPNERKTDVIEAAKAEEVKEKYQAL